MSFCVLSVHASRDLCEFIPCVGSISAVFGVLPWDGRSLNGLAGKIIKGKFPAVSQEYSKNLRVLVNDMLATNPKKRPDIEQVQ